MEKRDRKIQKVDYKESKIYGKCCNVTSSLFVIRTKIITSKSKVFGIEVLCRNDKVSHRQPGRDQIMCIRQAQVTHDFMP